MYSHKDTVLPDPFEILSLDESDGQRIMKTPKIALLITLVVALLLTSVMIVAAQDND